MLVLKSFNSRLACILLAAALSCVGTVTHAQKTKAEEYDVSRPPTVDTTAPNTTQSAPQSSPANADDTSDTDIPTEAKPEPEPKNTGANKLFGKTKITEHKRDNGQTYSIELEHSSGTKQYIEENDADGLNKSGSDDMQDSPNIAKWRLGSW